MTSHFDSEVILFVTYLTRSKSRHAVYEDYKSAISSLNLTFNEKESEDMKLLLRFPLLLPFFDAGLALLRPDHTIRKRLLVMLALLETEKNSHSLFIAHQNEKFPWFQFLFSATVASFKAFIGIIIVSLSKWR